MSTAESSPRFRLSRASSNAAGRSRLPTWSARNGGVSVAVVISPPGRVKKSRSAADRSQQPAVKLQLHPAGAASLLRPNAAAALAAPGLAALLLVSNTPG